jgi:outer membrane lipase/esterase
MKSWKILLSAVAAALVVVGCGGGGSTSTSTPVITSVKVVGDSLSDSGAFGFRFSMQSLDPANPMKVWTERVADYYGAPTLCPRFTASFSASLVPSTSGLGTPACNNYALGSARIYPVQLGITSKFSVVQQLVDLGTEKVYAKGDLLLVDGGGNDIADLTLAVLTTASGLATFTAATSPLLGPATVTALLTANPNATGTAIVGTLYSQALANTLYDAIKVNALDKGAQHIVIANAPDLTLTPRFQAVLAGVAAQTTAFVSATVPGITPAQAIQAGADRRAQVQGLVRAWASAFNTQLASRRAADSGKVVITDFYTALNTWVNTPVTPGTPNAFGLTNVTTPVCPIVGVEASTGLPTYNVPACEANFLSANPPVGATGGANWWKTYLFSDGFHATILGYQLFAGEVIRDATAAGWTR